MRADVTNGFIRTSYLIEGCYADATVIGIDPSPTNTGIGVLSRGKFKSFSIGWGAEINQVSRLAMFRDEVKGILERYEPAVVAIEGYSFGSKFSQPHKLGELGGTIKLCIRDYGCPLIVVPPTTLKQFVRGIGKGSKAQMVSDAKKRWLFKTSEHDEIDAGALAIVAAEVQYQIGQAFGHVLYKGKKDKGGVELFRW